MGPGDTALVKGSRVVRLEDVVRAYGEAEGARSLNPGAGDLR
jgi:UDP-N-acetylmuramoyl-tripeptide--D-alanyl-D-alanine ligase